jgi:glutaminyl-tRNA synthetase
MENAPNKFFRLKPGGEVRLRYAYFITCTDVVKDAAGNVIELRGKYDPATRGGNAPDGRKVKGTIHWVSAKHAYTATVRLYDHLFKTKYPDDAPAGGTWLDNVNSQSLETVADAKLEPSLAAADPGTHFQFERLGYFFTDPIDSKAGAPVFNRTVTLRDTWAKETAKK